MEEVTKEEEEEGWGGGVEREEEGCRRRGGVAGEVRKGKQAEGTEKLPLFLSSFFFFNKRSFGQG